MASSWEVKSACSFGKGILGNVIGKGIVVRAVDTRDMLETAKEKDHGAWLCDREKENISPKFSDHRMNENRVLELRAHIANKLVQQHREHEHAFETVCQS